MNSKVPETIIHLKIGKEEHDRAEKEKEIYVKNPQNRLLKK